MRAREGTSMPQKPAARNVSIELLRIVAMFLILTCHFVIHFDWEWFFHKSLAGGRHCDS